MLLCERLQSGQVDPLLSKSFSQQLRDLLWPATLSIGCIFGLAPASLATTTPTALAHTPLPTGPPSSPPSSSCYSVPTSSLCAMLNCRLICTVTERRSCSTLWALFASIKLRLFLVSRGLSGYARLLRLRRSSVRLLIQLGSFGELDCLLPRSDLPVLCVLRSR